MPIVDGKYVAPTWVNNGPPAMDQTEMQAMCNTIVQNQSDAAELQAAVQALTTTVNGKARVTFGSYTGDGGATKSINLGFSPSVVILCCEGVYRTNGQQYVYDGVATSSSPLQAIYTSTKKNALTLTGSGFTVYYNPNSSSYNPSSNTNISGEKYVYIAFE